MGKLIVIEQEQLSDETSCTCGNCSWIGPISQSDEVLDAILTPGDEVPAGRCPDCEALVYVVKPIEQSSAHIELLSECAAVLGVVKNPLLSRTGELAHKLRPFAKT